MVNMEKIRAITDRTQMQKISTSCHVEEYFFIPNKTRSTKTTGLISKRSSARENGKIFEICASDPLNTELIYLLKKSENAGLIKNVIYKRRLDEPMIKNILAKIGSFFFDSDCTDKRASSVVTDSSFFIADICLPSIIMAFALFK